MKTILRYCLFLILIAGFENAIAKTVAAPVIGTDATLKSIVLSTATTLVYTTGPSDFNYTTSVSPGTATLTVNPTTNDPAATVTVNGIAVASGTQSSPITLNGIVTTTINMLVTASDGVTTHTYSIVVYETGSNNAYLGSLTVSTGNTLVASSGSSNYNYATTVAPTVTSLTVTPTTADPTAQSVTVNGVAVTSGTASGAIVLNAIGVPTVINLLVTAQDGVTTLSYSITVSRTGSNIATLSSLSLNTNTNLVTSTGGSTFNYTAAVNPAVTSVTVKPTATDPNATVKVNGVAVASGSSSGSIPLNPIGQTTDITTIVTAQDGITTESYTITVSRTGSNVATLSSPPTLSSKSLLFASAGPGTFNYTTSIDPALTSITETAITTDPNSILTINGVVTASGSPSSPIVLNAAPATTTITAVVTSQDGSTTKSYVIVVSMNGSNDDNLAVAPVVSTNTVFTTAVIGGVTTFTTSVPAATASLTLTATASDPTRASITVNGIAVASGVASGSITLNAAPPAGTATNIPIVVTAQNGTAQTYNVIINRTGSNNAFLSALTLSNNALLVSLARGPGTQANYTTSVDAGTTTLAITPTTSDPSATITVTVNGVAGPAATSGSPFTVNLSATANTTVDMLVTAPDGVTTIMYVLTISTGGSNNANLVWPTTFSTGTSFTSASGSYNSNYTTTVSPNTTTLTVTPVPVDANATITVNGLSVANGTMSSPIPLNVTGTTLVVIVVTAADKKTTRSWGITVSKTGGIMYWTGAGADAYWDDVANWNTVTGKAPGAGDEASIGEQAFTKPANMPQIRSSLTIGEIVFGSYYATGTTLQIPSGYTLTVGTSLTINSGAIATLYGNNVLSEVDISAAAALNINPTGTLRLNIAGTNTTAPIIFKLKSNSSGSASVGQITSSSITYNNSASIQVERYIQGGSSVYRGYRLLSSPVYKASDTYGNKIYSLNYVQGTSLVTGITGPSGGFDAAGNPSLYLFREDVAANNGSFTGGNYWGISNLNFAPTYYLNGLAQPYNIPVGNGFFFFFRGDRTTNLANKYSPGTSAESVTMVTTGTLNAGPITVHDWYNPGVSTLSYTKGVANGTNIGLQLIGNPYPSSIDWDTYNSTTPGTGINVSTYTDTHGNTVPAVGNTIYVLDPVSKNYGVYIANSPFGGTNNATHVLPSGQGFFIQSFDPSATLTFNESAKTTLQVTGRNLLLGTPKQDVVSQYLHLKLLQNSFQADEIFVSFNDNAQSKFVLGEDAAQKPGNGIASLASISSDGIPLSINTLNLPVQSVAIPLNVNSVSDGAYQLTMPDIKSIPSIYEIWLMDAYKKDSVDFRNNPSYSFNISKSDAASYGSNRFIMVIRQNPVLGLRLVSFNAAKASNGAEVVWKTVNEQNYTNFTVERSTDGGVTFNVLGGFVSSALGTYSYLDKDPLMTANRYRLKLADLNGNISYSNIVTLIYGNSNNVAGNINVYPNPTSSTINLTITPFNNSADLQTNLFQPLTATNTSIVSYNIKIINITGVVIKTATSSSPAWQNDVSSLSPGTYIIQVVNNSNNSLVGKSTFVKL